MKTEVYKYGACECGGKVVEKLVTVFRHNKGKNLHEFENVPAGVCLRCGQRIYRGPVLERLDRLARSKTCVKRVIKVPVTDFQSAELASHKP